MVNPSTNWPQLLELEPQELFYYDKFRNIIGFWFYALVLALGLALLCGGMIYYFVKKDKKGKGD